MDDWSEQGRAVPSISQNGFSLAGALERRQRGAKKTSPTPAGTMPSINRNISYSRPMQGTSGWTSEVPSVSSRGPLWREGMELRDSPTKEWRDNRTEELTVDQQSRAQALQMRLEMAALRRQATLAIEKRDREFAQLQRALSAQRDLLDSQAAKLRDRIAELEGEVHHTARDAAESRQVASETHARASEATQQLALQADELRHSLHHSQLKVQVMRAERDILTEGLARIASATQSGFDPACPPPPLSSSPTGSTITPAEEWLPQGREVWSSFEYTGDRVGVGGAPRSERTQHLITSTNQTASEGERALDALVNVVAQLCNGRRMARQGQAEAMAEIQWLHEALCQLDAEYNRANHCAKALEEEVAEVGREAGWGTSSLWSEQPEVSDSTIAFKLERMRAKLQALFQDMRFKDSKIADMQARLVELEFYAQLHGSPSSPQGLTVSKEKG